MSEIIPFPRRQAADTGAEDEQKRKEDERVKRARLIAVRANLRAQPRMAKFTDRKAIATNLYQILDRLERERGISKAKILHSAGQGGPGDSTKRLPRFALQPGLEPAEEDKRAENLGSVPHQHIELSV